MTKSEIKELIKTKRSEADVLVKRSEKSEDLAEVRSLGEILTKLRDEINELEEQLTEEEPAERSTVPSDAELRHADVVKCHSITKHADGLALRSDETMVSRIKGEKSSKLDIGKCIRGMYTGNWEGADAEKREMTTSGTGVIIPAVCSAQVLDYARNTSLFGSANVPVYPMTSNNLTLARLSSDPTFKFKEEGKETSETSFDIDSVELKAKTCYGLAYVSIEAIESAQNLTDIILRSFGQAMATAIDKAMLYGQYNGSTFDSFAPVGIMNDTEINSIEATNNGYADYIKAIGSVRSANGDPTVLGMNAKTDEIISLKTDKQGQPLLAPKSFENLTKIISNQLAYDPENGSDALVFDPQALAIGVQNNLRFKMITDSDECIKKGLVAFQIYSMMDCKAIRPTHITKITGIKETVTV